MATPIGIAAYLALFVVAAALFALANLTIGRLLRPRRPSQEKLDVYECGEQVMGSSFVQFDIRFYVVALLFIIFDVEVAFFFPWAVVFGKATQLTTAATASLETEGELAERWSAIAGARLEELGLSGGVPTSEEAISELATAAHSLAVGCFLDILVFFSVLMVGFAYVWSRGDLNWVRSTINRALPTPSVGVPPRAA